MMIKAVPNANFTALGGKSVHESDDPRYLEYRRKWLDNPRQFVVEEYPVHLDIEVTNRCNLRCTFCDKLPYLTLDQFGNIDVGLFQRIIDEGSEHGLCSIKLSYRGEPLVHPKLAEMIAYAKARGVIDIYFNTNAMLLNVDRAQSLIDAGLNRISISVEGTDPVAFERARRGADFQKIRENIEQLQELKERMGVRHPMVRIQTVALPHIDLGEYARFWGPLCDETAVIDYKEAEERSTDLVAPEWACPQLWQRMTIEWDGKVMPCNNDDYRKLSSGRVQDMSVREHWHASRVERARELHRQGLSHQVESCNGCPWRTTQVLKSI